MEDQNLDVRVGLEAGGASSKLRRGPCLLGVRVNPQLSSLVEDAVDILQQRVDRGPTARGVRAVPPVRGEAGARLSFRLFPQIPNRRIDEGVARAFDDGVRAPKIRAAHA